MYRSAIGAAPRAAPRALFRTYPVRFASSTAAPSRGSWKGTALRWGLAIGALYWYNTSPLLQEDSNPTKTVPPPPQFSDDDAPTVEAVVAQKRKQAEAKALARQRAAEQEAKATSDEEGLSKPTTAKGEDGMGDLEEEAGKQAAFDPETGEINWDCPCLGGMADGPCGEEFKAAFSCFVFSEEEPKGINCIDKFQGMQDCFRKYPEHYASELADDEEADMPSQPQPAAQQQQPLEDVSNSPKEGTPAPQVNKNPEVSNPTASKGTEEKVEEAVDELAQNQEQLPPKPQRPKNPMRDAS